MWSRVFELRAWGWLGGEQDTSDTYTGTVGDLRLTTIIQNRREKREREIREREKRGRERREKEEEIREKEIQEKEAELVVKRKWKRTGFYILWFSKGFHS